MDLRQHALESALRKSFEETKRWEAYKKEHIDAEQNLKEFEKKIEIDVMVPIGPKAFMPGVIYHTNEVLVSHFQGHFSKVSTHQALELVNRRLKMSDDRLQSLEKEQMLYEQNLGVPTLEDAFMRNDGAQELIEDYDEEKEKHWREEHRVKVKQMKQQEAAERTGTDVVKTDEDIFALLEEREMMEELESELEALDIDDDEKLEKLLKGEVKPPPEKKRVAHATTISRPKITTYTNNNHIANQQDFSPSSPVATDSELDDDTDSDAEVPLEFKKLAETAKKMSRIEKIHFYKQHLNAIKLSIRETRINDEHDLMKRIDEIELKEVLEDTIDDLRLEEDDEEEGGGDGDVGAEDDSEDDVTASESEEDEKLDDKRRISFSNDIKVEYINSGDAPIQISINNNPALAETVAATAASQVPSAELPIHEPRLDYDPKQTVQIKFKHSDEVWTLPSRERDLIGNPLDLYKKVRAKNGQNKKGAKGKGSNKGKWKEKEKKGGPMEVAVTSATVIKESEPPAELKSILKNCSRVEAETHHDMKNNNPDVDEATEEKITQRKKKDRETFVCEAPDFSTVSGFLHSKYFLGCENLSLF